MSTDDPRRAMSAGTEPSLVAPDEAEAFRPPERTLPAVPSWVTDVRKWQSLSRPERRALERHHRKQLKR